MLLTCGNGAVDAGEECDDANETAGDGCEIDCTYTCHDHAECSDNDVCNGTEVCVAETHVCEPGTAADDGEVCGESPRRICLDGLCADSLCGDGFVDVGGGESCEPPGVDACSDLCRYACSTDTDCPDDGEMCNGEEFCDTDLHECGRRDVPPDGTMCSSDPYGECRDGTCRDAEPCGNGRIDPGEDCDEGPANSDTRPDACRTDCTDPGCGDGVVDSDEECDSDTSAFCSSSCSLTAPVPGCWDPWPGCGAVIKIASTGACVISSAAPGGAEPPTASADTPPAPEGVGVEPKAPPSKPQASVARATTGSTNSMNHERWPVTIECRMWILLW